MTPEESRYFGAVSRALTAAEPLPDTPPAKQPWMRNSRFQDQDICITESIGPDVDLSQENLGSSDVVIGRVHAVSVALPRETASWTGAIAQAVDTRPETFISSV
jgi:hypothetical protein